MDKDVRDAATEAKKTMQKAWSAYVSFHFFPRWAWNIQKKEEQHEHGCQIRIAKTDTTNILLVIPLFPFLVFTQEGYETTNTHVGNAVPDSFSFEPWKLDISTHSVGHQ